jgi:acetylornithine/succinyldiaminopimelate/putrescine aminotransferase
VTQAVARQAETLTFYSAAAPLEIRRRAAEHLCRFAGAGLERVFFCNSGAEANENALKLAVQLSGRRRIAALHGAFHGRTLLALSVTDGDAGRAAARALLDEPLRLVPNDAADLARLDDTIAAMIVEPVQSLAGVVELHDSYLAALRRRCDEVGCLLIYDEVQTGMGRLGRPLVAGRAGVAPDMATLAKGLANGIPAGALLVTPRIAGALRLGDLGSTFGGGPVACAAMLAVLETIESDGLLKQAARLGEDMHAALCTGPVREVLGRGCLIGLRTTAPARVVQRALLDRGFVTGTSNDARVLRLMPAINTPLAAVQELAAALTEMGETIDETLAATV